ncbi:MAG: glycosyltransferase family 39 protein [Chloroflexota bacterium]|nr:glycosyltransferase family 39 protein [Chloroflexota bacterium]
MLESQKFSQSKSDYQKHKRIISRKGNPEILLWILSLVIYLTTRLIRLPDFPIYFFTDEAIQTQHAADLVANSFRSPEGVFLPTYFENGGQYNLSLSVYVQVIPTLLFGKSIWVTRGTSVLLTLLGAIFLSLILRDHFKSRLWWLGTLLLAATPTWFLHSRTAFETVLMASMVTPFLYFYLCYRQGALNKLYPALIFGALAFYAYSPGQVIVVLTGLCLLITDAGYHWQHKKTALAGLVLLCLLALPYLRFLLTHENELSRHLTLLNSYWVKNLPLIDKMTAFFIRYLKGFNPFYWFWPRPSLLESLMPDINLPTWLFSNQHDLDRHTMKSYGHILWVSFPFFIIGLAHIIKRYKEPGHRALLVSLLAAPSGAAIVDWGITRGMVFVIPATLLSAVGLEKTLNWISLRWRLKSQTLVLLTFLILTLIIFGMLNDALVNGPTWYTDYGLSGMQYGAQQVFTRAVEIARSQPQTRVLVSSTWANGTDVFLRYFGDDLPNLQMGNINAYGLSYKPLDANTLFIMTEEDLSWIEESGKFTNVRIDETLPYPDGSIGFYFVRLEYVPNIREILAGERDARQALRTAHIIWQGEKVQVAYPALDINEIQAAFDGDSTSLIRTLEANPLKLIVTFSEPRLIQSVKVRIGGTPTRVTISAFSGDNQSNKIVKEVGSAAITRDITLQFEKHLLTEKLGIEIFNPHDSEVAHVHLWEVSYK